MTPTALEDAQKDSRPPAKLQTEEFRVGRPEVVGPEVPESPFPITLEGKVQRGFGRGGKDLGCPTANLPDESITPMSSVAKTGVYYGYAQVIQPDVPSGLRRADIKVLPMVMSMGWNPFYKNERLTAEIHIMHEFQSDFYGYEMKAIVLGYIRPELDYTSREALIDDIEFDKRVALNCLQRPAYQSYSKDPFFEKVELNGVL
ncbi:riboflavin kinase [Coprinopsis marcescibilis]|uniref:Riboflavin kinase n=1 Tax=Coprinopsis marcescibilis TaxID=230819 RepID=A0A5C3L3C5_COPMA|nr:riboflavin kinase [Coprinopsis marcescibilis]